PDSGDVTSIKWNLPPMATRIESASIYGDDLPSCLHPWRPSGGTPDAERRRCAPTTVPAVRPRPCPQSAPPPAPTSMRRPHRYAGGLDRHRVHGPRGAVVVFRHQLHDERVGVGPPRLELVDDSGLDQVAASEP